MADGQEDSIFGDGNLSQNLPLQEVSAGSNVAAATPLPALPTPRSQPPREVTQNGAAQTQANPPRPTGREGVLWSPYMLNDLMMAEAGSFVQPGPAGSHAPMDVHAPLQATSSQSQGYVQAGSSSSTRTPIHGYQLQIGGGSRPHAGAGHGQLAPDAQITTDDTPLYTLFRQLPQDLTQRITDYVDTPRPVPPRSITRRNHGSNRTSGPSRPVTRSYADVLRGIMRSPDVVERLEEVSGGDTGFIRPNPSLNQQQSEEGRNRMAALRNLSATAILLYHVGGANHEANDIWPNLRNPIRCPVQYRPIDISQLRPAVRGERIEVIWPPLSETQNNSSTTAPTPGVQSGKAPNNCPGWPPGRMPTELYELVASYLNRDDIKSMRLVCREFDRHVSQVLFKTVVVPFNAEIYGMIREQKAALNGKLDDLSWSNGEDDSYYLGHGLNVFKGFGKHILRFGMSFEVSEEMLQNLPEKKETESRTSFWGTYEWPYAEYKRFAAIAGLENTADETPKMKTAFSELKKVQELALSVDSGLGWLNGPDRSLRALFKRRSPKVFGSDATVPDRRTQAQDELWSYIESCHREKNLDPKRACLYKMDTTGLFLNPDPLDYRPSAEQPQVPYFEPYILREASDATDDDKLSLASPFAGTGVLFTANSDPENSPSRDWPALAPAQLTKAQKEWLLETEWAQKAFLLSYMLAVIDNATTFNLVHTLHISRISDRYLDLLDRADFWDALPNLKKVILRAIPTWRTVRTDEAGFAKDTTIDPSGGVDSFYNLLQKRICPRHISHLGVGWATGGEHAEGVHARNQHLLPAPLLPRHLCTSLNQKTIDSGLLLFPYVGSLTLENCWIMPSVLEQFVKQHDSLNLEHLELDSVSLILIPEDGNGQNAQAGGPPPVLQQLVDSLRGLMRQVQGVKDVLVRLSAFAQGSTQFSLTDDWQGRMTQLRAQMSRLGPMIWQMQPPLQTALLLAFHTVNNSYEHLRTQQQRVDSGLRQGFRYWSGTSAQQARKIEVQEYQQLLQRLGSWYQETQNLMAMVPQVGNGTDAINAQAQLRARPRAGSWLSVLDFISPGVNLADYGSEFSRADAERGTALESISLRSCGYAKIFTAALNGGVFARLFRDPLQQTRRINLLPVMLNGGAWELLGDIVQDINEEELAALNAAWDLVTGWEDAEASEGPEYDGWLPGGTGRLTGTIQRRLSDDDVMDSSS
ncbi:uncharacterized protein EI97DRAFT_432825 [Westerdykella ornata]|uniref:F-box domain-containing protein n=1 Tax=Westerdykella ornata TaxID=318751 RepID=A0A6A6JNJ3_WESOR|nr:uncharacterized protein EI97DRAFT_432825 [Westerdykella ornata]KAF2277226.1 hypothetical protein EI97DRAFT_432825 [Westerdykella ornata]